MEIYRNDEKYKLKIGDCLQSTLISDESGKSLIKKTFDNDGLFIFTAPFECDNPINLFGGYSDEKFIKKCKLLVGWFEFDGVKLFTPYISETYDTTKDIFRKTVKTVKNEIKKSFKVINVKQITQYTNDWKR